RAPSSVHPAISVREALGVTFTSSRAGGGAFALSDMASRDRMRGLAVCRVCGWDSRHAAPRAPVPAELEELMSLLDRANREEMNFVERKRQWRSGIEKPLGRRMFVMIAPIIMLSVFALLAVPYLPRLT